MKTNANSTATAKELCDAYEHSTGKPGANLSWNSRNIRLVLLQKGE
jgi:hypothetical protein